MKSRMKIEKPGDVEVTLSITMKASEWEELRGQLSTRYPSWRISAAINDLLAQVRKVLWWDAPEAAEDLESAAHGKSARAGGE